VSAAQGSLVQRFRINRQGYNQDAVRLCSTARAERDSGEISMAETGLTLTIQPTALASLLESTHIAHELTSYRGMLTPRHLDVPASETAALAESAAIYDLGWMRRVAVRGQDRFRWLSGMVTNTVNDLFPNSGAWNFVLNVQGRIQGDLVVWREGEELSPMRRNADGSEREGVAGAGDRLTGTPFAGESGLQLEISADQYDKLLAHLNRFIVMDDVELVPLDEEQFGDANSGTAIGLAGPLAGAVLERVGLPAFTQPMTGKRVEWNGWDLTILRGYGVRAPHYELWAPAAGLSKLWSCVRAAGAAPVGCAIVEAFRIAEGIPAYGVDIAERDLPQETSQMRALHFNKGCYLGQEIVERIRSRGNVHRHLRPLELFGPLATPGTELTLDGGSGAGQITSAAELPLASGSRAFALGMIQAEAEEKSQEFQYSADGQAGRARILAAPPALGS
jgi:folate-binding protein YgfZ